MYFLFTGFVYLGHIPMDRRHVDTDWESLILPDPSQQFSYASGKVVYWKFWSRNTSNTQSISLSTWRPVKTLTYKLQGVMFVNGTKRGRTFIRIPKHIKQWEV